MAAAIKHTTVSATILRSGFCIFPSLPIRRAAEWVLCDEPPTERQINTVLCREGDQITAHKFLIDIECTLMAAEPITEDVGRMLVRKLTYARRDAVVRDFLDFTTHRLRQRQITGEQALNSLEVVRGLLEEECA